MTDPVRFDVQTLAPILPGQPDDLLVACSSFEQRGAAILDLLRRDYRVRHAVILEYLQPDRAVARRVRACVDQLKDGLAPHATESLSVVACNRSEPMTGVREIDRVLRQSRLSLLNARITLDISTLTKQYELVLLKYFDGRRQFGVLRCIYTTTSQYGARVLTKGIRNVGIVPGFEGSYDIRKAKVLFLFLGFERDRALAIWNATEPERTVPILGTEADRPGWQHAACEFNRTLLHRAGVEAPRELPAFDPYGVWHELRVLYLNYAPTANVFIAPLGTKAQVLGIYLLAARDLANIRVVYPEPYRYKVRSFEKGVGASYEYAV